MTSHEEIAGFEEIPMDVQVELDRKTMTMKQVLELETGSVIRMTRSAGENIDVLVGGTVVAFGEIVIIEDSTGVRITDFNVEE
jgi:flagellar motor switch protein FliN/FliY